MEIQAAGASCRQGSPQTFTLPSLGLGDWTASAPPAHICSHSIIWHLWSFETGWANPISRERLDSIHRASGVE